MKLESTFQKTIIDEAKRRWPGCVVLKNDANYIQGFPDLLVLHGDKWAALECKRSAEEHHQPNQDYYIDKLDYMGFAAFIFPENREAVMDEIEDWFTESE